MNYVENSLEVSDSKELTCGKVINAKPSQSFNESNLMTLPFISLKRTKESILKRKWIRNNVEVELTVKGSTDLGCPTIYEMDVLMALFKIQLKNMDNKIVVSSDNKVENMSDTINFTYRELAKEMGLKGFGKKTKERLENSIKCLVETTIYSKQAVRNQIEGEYVSTFEGEESARIISKYKKYSVTTRKLENKNLLSPEEIKESQSIKIDKFFFDNIVGNYFKLYDYDKYKTLKNSIAKKMLLILTQWSHGNEKYIKLQTLYDYLGIVIETKQEEYYWNRRIRAAIDELKQVKFVQECSFNADNGINLVFNTTVREKNKGLDKYKTDAEIVCRLRELGVDYDDITKFCRMDTMSYVAALLRYIDHRQSNGTIDDVTKFTLKGLPYGKYDVSEYEVNI